MRRLLLLLVGLTSCRSPEKQATPTTRSTASAAPSTAAPAPPLAMFPWLTAKDAVRVHDVAGAPMVTAGTLVMRLGESVSQEPALGEGIEGNAEPVRVTGEFPDATFLVVALSHRVTGAPLGERAYRWYAKRWAPAASPLHDNPPLGVAEHDGATVALFATQGGGLKLEVVRATRLLTLPALPLATDACPAPFVLPRVALVDLGGALSLVGDLCDGRRASVLVLGGEKPREGSLPAGMKIASVRARGASLFVAGNVGGKAALVQYDGKETTNIAVPLDGPLSALALGTDGSAWVASDRKIARRAPAGVWSQTELPGVVTGVVAADGSHAWVSVETADGSSLFGLTQPREVVVVPDKRASFGARGQHGKALATAACTSLWVPLVAVGKSGWVPDDLPWLRESIAAKRELEGIQYLAEDDGRDTWVGALVPTLNAGERLVAEVGDRIGIAGQRVTCHTPHVVATFVDGRRDKRK